MCLVRKLFTEQGFEVVAITQRGKRPMVTVRGIPSNYRIKSNTAHCTSSDGGQYRLGLWLGCHVAVIESTH